MIEVQAVIDKKDIAVLGALKGMANDTPLEVGGVEYKLGDIVFRGFAGGMHMDDRRYHGVVRFDERTGEVALCSFTPIVRAMDLTESEVDDGLDGDDNRRD